ncbi:unnamed protein product [Vitrella brassicaformis CCMP3155]|uniref:mannose-1-phosphate guanylyltransferase n=1 Tax=Vitrella brassicaformis (strain CCMP3155) TaxID=1169540 RepID=A0A0G4F675_VITBC|nr:unnamed protein product [Vitrella brassicaformis CCMP3155]|eukprot:CEM07905.1 unnamed protein product [Vitrella brassicaformis CCMP3155]
MTKALILVGGYGTRLRPLTLSVPKPLIHFCNKSIVEHQIEALVNQAGVNHVILAVAYQPDAMIDALHHLESKFGIRITCSREEEPLGTAGPIRLAKDLIVENGDDSDSFFVCNSDVICEFPLKEMIAFHQKHGQEGTILVTKVDDPSKYGVVVAEDDGKIERFVEKPKEFVGDCINAGLYIFRKSIIDRIEPRPTSIEKEVFPVMAAEGALYRMKLQGYWADIGQPKDFLKGMHLYLDSVDKKWKKGQIEHDDEIPKLAKGDKFIGNVLVSESATIGDGCLIGPDVTIGPNCRIDDGVRIQRSALMEGVTVRSYSWIDSSILGWESTVGKWVRIEGLTVVGQDVQINKECYINGAFILPHKGINNSIHTSGTIVM